MKSFRTVLFGSPRTHGATAGVVILIMSVTGVALTYEKQMLEWADRRAASVVPGPAHLAPEQLLWTAATAMPGKAPIGLTLRGRKLQPSRLKGMPRCSWIRTGALIGELPARIRSFFRTMTLWHRYFARGHQPRHGEGDHRRRQISISFLVVSGLYLWFPRAWNWIQFRNVLWFRRAAGKGA